MFSEVASKPSLADVVERVCAEGLDLSELKAHLAQFPMRADNAEEEKSSPLMIAATYGRADCLDALITAGSSPNFACRSDDITLSNRGMLATMDWFMNGNGSTTPLYVCAMKGHLECVSLLLMAGADVHSAHSRDGSTPLFAACDQGHRACAERLLAAGALVDAARHSDGRTPLAAACAHGHDECAQLLVEAGADVDRQTASGDTPMSLAFESLQRQSVALRRSACVAMLRPVIRPKQDVRMEAMKVRRRPRFHPTTLPPGRPPARPSRSHVALPSKRPVCPPAPNHPPAPPPALSRRRCPSPPRPLPR